jgi:hypothetical protein
MRLKLSTICLVVLSGCATVSADAGAKPTPAEAARLAALPRVPLAPAVPAFPAELRGLSFHVMPVVEGAVLSNSARADVQRACAANFEQWMGAAGWIPVDPQAAADLVIVEHCTAGLSTSWNGALLELRHSPSQTVAITVLHDGAPVLSVPRGPDDYVCASTAPDVRRDCLTRSEAWAQAHILETLIASQPLAALARQLGSAR